MSGRARPALAVVPATGMPAAPIGRYEPRLPGIGARYVSGLHGELESLGWSAVEIQSLLAAAEERCGLWLITPRRMHLPVQVQRWRSGRFTRAQGLAELAAACAAAPRALGVCVAAVSGRGEPPGAVRRALAEGPIQIGRVSGGEAPRLHVTWAVEVLVAPSLGVSALAGMRERIAAAPRCAWCHLPVLGSSCPRCRVGAG
jgi:hypothetical protein